MGEDLGLFRDPHKAQGWPEGSFGRILRSRVGLRSASVYPISFYSRPIDFATNVTSVSA
jgi:hypothetical protein